MKFAAGTPEAAAIYEKSVERLTEHIGIQAWRGVSELTQAIEKMKNVEYEEPEEPVRLYYSNTDRTKTTTEPTKDDGSPHTPVTSDGLYAVELQRYVNQHKSWEVKDSQYNENRSRAFNLILQHCPESVKTEVKNAEKWKEVSGPHDAIGLLGILRDLAHGKKERKQSTMVKVKADLAMYATLQTDKQTLEDYARIYNAQVDVINANGGQAGYNAEIFNEHLQRILKEKGKDATWWRERTDDQRKPILKDATKAACDEFLACLFLLNADPARYGGLEQELANDYVKHAHDKDAAKRIYPDKLLGMKRVMQDHGGAKTAAKKTTPAPDGGVAFQETGHETPGDGKRNRPKKAKCRVCGKRHPFGDDPTKCRNASKERKDQVLAEIAREEAAKANPSPAPATRPPRQQGTTNTNVQADE